MCHVCRVRRRQVATGLPRRVPGLLLRPPRREHVSYGHWRTDGPGCDASGVISIGITVIIRDALTLDDVGTCTASTPVEPGDLVALEH
jgi:hypothetical protein